MNKQKKIMIAVGSAAVLVIISCVIIIILSFRTEETRVVRLDYSDKTRNYYEILVYSFADSNGDGVGDFKGIKEKIPYLKELGINAIVLSPVNPSDSYHGYTVTDYYEINNDFVVDNYSFEDLVKDCSYEDIAVVMDFVVNHTSTECKWFKEGLDSYSKGTVSKYKYYYNFLRAAPASQDDYRSIDGIYYEAVYDKTMPDLKLNNQDVIDEMVNVADYWLKKGVYGFRLDPLDMLGSTPKESIGILTKLCEGIKSKNKNAFLIGEVKGTTGDVKKDKLNKYSYEQFYASGIDALYVFNQKDKITLQLNGRAGYAQWLASNQEAARAYNNKAIEGYLMSNHDIQRISEDYATNQLKVAAALMILAPGNPFVYYGEEIGMRGIRSIITDTDDFSAYLDAAYRTPMYWDRDTNLSAKYIVENTDGWVTKCETVARSCIPALEQKTDNDSLWTYYKKLLNIKKGNPILATGTITSYDIENNDIVLYFLEERDVAEGVEPQIYIVVHNTSAEKKHIISFDNIIINSKDSEYVSVAGEEVKVDEMKLTMPPYSSVIANIKKTGDIMVSLEE